MLDIPDMFFFFVFFLGGGSEHCLLGPSLRMRKNESNRGMVCLKKREFCNQFINIFLETKTVNYD